MKITESQLRQIIKEEIQEGFGQWKADKEAKSKADEEKINAIVTKIMEVAKAAWEKRQYGVVAVYVSEWGKQGVHSITQQAISQQDANSVSKFYDIQTLLKGSKVDDFYFIVKFAHNSELMEYLNQPEVYKQDENVFHYDFGLKAELSKPEEFDKIIEFFE